MSIRATAFAAVCAATLVASHSVSAQDTTRNRDTITTARQMQMQQRTNMTMQARDSIIRQLSDSANRLTDPRAAQQLRDSVAVLRRLDLTTDTMSGRLGTPLTQQQRVTSDQRMRVQKDGRSWNDTSGTNR